MTVTTPASPAPITTVRSAVARQTGVVAAQIVAGSGNLTFSLVAVRLLPGPHYAQFAAFLAGYLLINTPAASLTAGAALRPDLVRRARPIAALCGIGVGLTLAAAAPWIGPAARLPVALVVLLALDAPVAGVLALTRGQLFGRRQVAAATTGIVTEPAVRCAGGLALLPAFGTVGAATGVLLGGYAALAVCLVLERRAGDAVAAGRGPAAPATVVSFLLLAAIGAQDVIIANRVLPGDQAGLFAVVSTLGGVVFFATATVPMVVMSQLRDRHRHALPTALGVTLATSLLGAGAVLAVPSSLLAHALGLSHSRLGGTLPVYLAAMVFLCLARVFVAALCARGRGRLAWAAGAVAAATQVTLLVRAATATQAAGATLAGAAVLLAASGTAVVLTSSDTAVAKARHAAVRRRPRSWNRADTWWLLGTCAVGVGIRLSTDRSVWIDEAISVHEAVQPYGQMLHLLRTTDVHPPLYFTLLWAVVHGTGSTAEAVVRLPSLLAGVLLVAVSYLAARDLWDRRTARFAGVVAAIGPAAVWYSQDARMYALFMLFATVAAWMLVRILREASWRDVAVFAGSCVALLWTQYDTVLPVATLFAIFAGVAIWRAWRMHVKRLLAQVAVAAAVVAAAFVPLVPWVVQQYGHTAGLSSSVPAQTGTTQAQPSVNAYSALANGAWALFGYHSNQTMLLMNAFWPLLILLVLAALGRGPSVPVRVLLAMAVVAPLVLFVVAQRRSDMFDLRYFAATVPALNLLVARAVSTWGRGAITRVALPALLCVALVAGLVDEQVNRSNPRVYDFRGAVAYVRTHARPDDLLLYGPSYLAAELDYYRPGIPARPITGVPQPKRGQHVFVLGSFLTTRAASGQVGTAVVSLKQHRHLDRVVHLPNVTVWEFS